MNHRDTETQRQGEKQSTGRAQDQNDKGSVPEGQRAEPLSSAIGYDDQDENGVDLSLLRANLKLTPTERWAKHQRALLLVLEVRRAGITARLRARAGRS